MFLDLYNSGMYLPKVFKFIGTISIGTLHRWVKSYERYENADALLLLTEWNEFRRPDFDRLKSLLKTPIIFDGRNQYDVNKIKNKDIEYVCIGINCA